MYKPVDPNVNVIKREDEVLKFWTEKNIFARSLKMRESGGEFVFYDGPPTANGKPHIGHVLTRIIKDIIPRYKTMKGFHVRRKAGWDTHGLPVELEVEKSLTLNGKQDIEKYGIEPFIKQCKDSVFKYTAEWRRMSERVGYWVDMDNPYITYTDDYIESVWWSIKTIFDKGLIYKGHKIVPYCPRCGTALSSHEVAQGYVDVKEKSIVAKFRLEKEPDTCFLAWTTTPWTLPSNAALCVNPTVNYVKIRAGNEKYILAEQLVSKHFTDFEILERNPGSYYERTKYLPLFDFVKEKNAFYVTCADFVTLTDGTGIVHIAPAFGEDDSGVGRAYNLPFIQLVNERGLFVELAAPYAGMFAKDADKHIIKDLKKAGLLFSEIMFEHSYPHCWRCHTPLLYYARDTWFIRMTAIKDKLVANNASVNWMPDAIGKGRMGNFLENVLDWGLSRERYWGTPLPLWVCKECGKIQAVGSKSELRERGKIKGDIELHKPYVDKVAIACSCGGTMLRTPEVIDCWYDSGSMPFAQMHYPFENKELFEKLFPADYISEAVDQTRGWFYTLLAISTLLFDTAPFKNCIVLGHVCDESGKKMSKHIGNVVEPFSVIDVHGADAVRWYFSSNGALYLPSRFSAQKVEKESLRGFLSTLWNTYYFYILYAEIDKFDPQNINLSDCKLSVMDRFVLSKLNTLIKKVDDNLADYGIVDSAKLITAFVEQLSNWYVRRCRERFWGASMSDDKKAAFMTLYTVLIMLCKLIAPFVPFVAESIYRNLTITDANAPESVHLCDFPVADNCSIDKQLEADMGVIIEIVELGRSIRNAVKIKNRQPLNKMLIASSSGELPANGLMAVALEELNINSFESVANAGEYITYELKPQLKTLGPKYGARLTEIKERLCADAVNIYNTVKSGLTYMIGDMEITEADLLISAKSREGFASESSSGITVILDTTLTPELVSRGIAREIVSKIQSMRKEAGFNITDHILIYIQTDDAEFKKAFDMLIDEICADCLADRVSKTPLEVNADWEINGIPLNIGIKQI